MHRKILVATTNPGKIAEFSAMLDLNIDWLGLKDLPAMEDVVEDGTSFEENARKKAISYSMRSGMWALADDSGLCIDALDGEPGVKSARFSGEKAPDEERTLIDHRNIKKVLKLLEGVPVEKRTARFVCSLCLADGENMLAEVLGTVEGLITKEELGSGGFGYDPIFYLPKFKKTAAQLTREEKNNISHRGNAIRKLKPLLTKVLEEY